MITSMIPNREFKLNELSKVKSSASEIDTAIIRCVDVHDYGALYYTTNNSYDLASAINLIKIEYPNGCDIKLHAYKKYCLKSQIILESNKYNIVSDFGMATIYIDESVNQPDYFIKTSGGFKNIIIEGIVSRVGNAILLENTTSQYNFMGNVTFENVKIRKANKSLVIGNNYSCSFTNLVCEYKTYGVAILPQHSSLSDSGYATISLWLNCRFRFNYEYGFYTESYAGIRQTNFINTSIEGNLGTTVGYQAKFNKGYSTFNTLYLEGSSTIPVITFNEHTTKMSDIYMNGTGGLTLLPSTSNISIDKLKPTSDTDVLSYTPSSIITVSIIDSVIKNDLLLTGKNLYIRNSTIGTTIGYLNEFTSKLTIGPDSNTSIKNILGYTFTVSTTIPANSSKRIKTDAYSNGINTSSVLIPYLSSEYHEGLQLYITRSSGGSNHYFSVIAVNTTASNIVLSGSIVNILGVALSSFVSI